MTAFLLSQKNLRPKKGNFFYQEKKSEFERKMSNFYLK